MQNRRARRRLQRLAAKTLCRRLATIIPDVFDPVPQLVLLPDPIPTPVFAAESIETEEPMEDAHGQHNGVLNAVRPLPTMKSCCCSLTSLQQHPQAEPTQAPPGTSPTTDDPRTPLPTLSQTVDLETASREQLLEIIAAQGAKLTAADDAVRIMYERDDQDTDSIFNLLRTETALRRENRELREANQDLQTGAKVDSLQKQLQEAIEDGKHHEHMAEWYEARADAAYETMQVFQEEQAAYGAWVSNIQTDRRRLRAVSDSCNWDSPKLTVARALKQELATAQTATTRGLERQRRAFVSENSRIKTKLVVVQGKLKAEQAKAGEVSIRASRRVVSAFRSLPPIRWRTCKLNWSHCVNKWPPCGQCCRVLVNALRTIVRSWSKESKRSNLRRSGRSRRRNAGWTRFVTRWQSCKTS